MTQVLVSECTSGLTFKNSADRQKRLSLEKACPSESHIVSKSTVKGSMPWFDVKDLKRPTDIVSVPLCGHLRVSTFSLFDWLIG